MKFRRIQKTCALLTAAALVCCMTSCGSTSTDIDITAKQFADLLYAKVPLTGKLAVRSSKTIGLLLNLTDYADAAGYTANGQTPDMVAVFCGADASQTKALTESMQVYVDEMKREYEKYAPDQVEKLETARIVSAGNYAVLCITPDVKTADEILDDIFETGTCELPDLRKPMDENTAQVTTAATTISITTDTTADSLPMDSDTGTNPIPSGEVVIPSQNDYQDFGVLFRDGDTAFEAYAYGDAEATKYAEALNDFASRVPSTVNVYAMPIPTSAGITLPDDLVGKCSVQDQGEAISKICAKFSSGIHAVNIYDTMRGHRGEYIYFRTDHHWTALGCYYAFAELFSQMGKTAPKLSNYTTHDYTGFLGSFYRDTNENAKLGANPDVLTAYYGPNYDSIQLQYVSAEGETVNWHLISDVTDYIPRLKYSAFASGDNPMVTTTNAAVTDGSVCILVKESFGNALVPFLADRYQTVYAFDYRYDQRDFTAFVAEHPNADVIFANNVSAIQSSYHTGKMAVYLG